MCVCLPSVGALLRSCDMKETTSSKAGLSHRLASLAFGKMDSRSGKVRRPFTTSGSTVQIFIMRIFTLHPFRSYWEFSVTRCRGLEADLQALPWPSAAQVSAHDGCWERVKHENSLRRPTLKLCLPASRARVSDQNHQSSSTSRFYRQKSRFELLLVTLI